MWSSFVDQELAQAARGAILINWVGFVDIEKRLTIVIEHGPMFLVHCNAQGRDRVLVLHIPGGDYNAGISIHPGGGI